MAEGEVLSAMNSKEPGMRTQRAWMVVLYGLIVSSIKVLILNLTHPLVRSEIIGSLRFLSGEVVLDERLPLTEVYRRLADFPLVRFGAAVGEVIGNFNYESLQFFLISYLFFIGAFSLCNFFIKEERLSLAVSILLSLTPFMHGLFNYSYPFDPVTGKTYGPLAQGFQPLILFLMVSGHTYLIVFALVLLTLFHPAHGILFSLLASAYIVLGGDYKARDRVVLPLVILSLMGAYAFYISTLQGATVDIDYDAWKEMMLVVSGHHVYPWLFKYDLQSLVYTAIVLLSLNAYIARGKEGFRETTSNLSALRRLTVVTVSFIFLMISVSIVADFMHSIRVLSIYPARLATLLVFLVVVHIAVVSKHLLFKYGAKGVPLLVILVALFYYSPFLFFPFLLLLWLRPIERFPARALVPAFSFFIFVFCLLKISGGGIALSLEPKKVLVASLYTSAWLLAWLFTYLRRPFDFLVRRCHVLLVLLISAGLFHTYMNEELRSNIGVNMDERKLIGFIDREIPREKVIFVFVSPSSKDYNYLYYFSQAGIRNVVPDVTTLANITYFPWMLRDINAVIKAIYGAEIEDIAGMDIRKLFALFYERSLGFSEDDWPRIKGLYRNFDYVLMTDDCGYRTPEYFIEAFRNRHFKLYRVDWKRLGEAETS